MGSLKKSFQPSQQASTGPKDNQDMSVPGRVLAPMLLLTSPIRGLQQHTPREPEGDCVADC
jgi:hypothetical protein